MPNNENLDLQPRSLRELVIVLLQKVRSMDSYMELVQQKVDKDEFEKVSKELSEVKEMVSKIEKRLAIEKEVKFQGEEKERKDLETAAIEADLKVKKSKRIQTIIAIVSGLILTSVIIYSYLSE